MQGCKVCGHPQHQLVDAALAAGITPLRRIAADFLLSESSLRRHRANHLPNKLAVSVAARRVAESDDLYERVRALRAKALDLLKVAEDAGEVRTALSAIRETRGVMELMAKVEGVLESGTSVAVNVQTDSGWPVLRTAILETLTEYPDALAAIRSRLSTLERES